MTQPPDLEQDVLVLTLSLKSLSKALDSFVSSCLNEEGKPKAPDYRAIMQAKACLPPYCDNAFQKKKTS